VIPKALRETAGLAEGDEVEVVFDGQKLILAPCGRDTTGPGLPVAETGGLVREARSGYAPATPQGNQISGDRPRLSKVWADRVRALAAIERLRAEAVDLNFNELWSEARREMEDGDDHA
jgi:AbrB family looped-hinge helix DNA binding protein